MKKVIVPLLFLPLFFTSSCADVWGGIDTVLSFKGEVTDTVIENSVEGARRYCGTVPRDRREEFRNRTDVDGLGPVAQINCENFSEFAGSEEFGGGGGP